MIVRTRISEHQTTEETVEDGGVLAGLIVLSLVQQLTGSQYTQEEIAFVCGCSHKNIGRLEARAIEKLRTGYIDAFIRRGIITGMETPHELEQKIWAAITHDSVVIANQDYETVSGAVKEVVRQGLVSGSEVTIVTQEVADRMLEAKIKDELK